MWTFRLINLPARVGIIIGFAAFVSITSANAQTPRQKLSANDQAEILRLAFDEGFEKLMSHDAFQLCTIPIVEDQKIILIETTDPKLFPKRIGEFRFHMLSDEGIEQEIKSNNGDCYFKISGFQVLRPNEARITLWRWIEVITNYPGRWVHAVGRVYKATKAKGKWHVTFLRENTVVS